MTITLDDRSVFTMTVTANKVSTRGTSPSSDKGDNNDDWLIPVIVVSALVASTCLCGVIYCAVKHYRRAVSARESTYASVDVCQAPPQHGNQLGQVLRDEPVPCEFDHDEPASEDNGIVPIEMNTVDSDSGDDEPNQANE